VHLFDFIIRIYHDKRSYECQIRSRFLHLLKLLVFKLDTYIVLVLPLNTFPIVSTQCTFKASGILDLNRHEFY